MNCPFCGKFMENGKLYNGRRDIGLIWLPEEAKLPLLFSEEKIHERNGIILSEATYIPFIFPFVNANVCRDCRRGVFELPEEVIV